MKTFMYLFLAVAMLGLPVALQAGDHDSHDGAEMHDGDHMDGSKSVDEYDVDVDVDAETTDGDHEDGEMEDGDHEDGSDHVDEVDVDVEVDATKTKDAH